MNNSRVHTCEECGESFSHGIGLRKHQRTTGHKNPEPEESSLAENVEKLKSILEAVPQKSEPEWESTLEELTKTLAFKKMQFRIPELKFTRGFTGQLQDVWESLHDGHLSQSRVTELDHGLGYGIGHKMASWIWEQIQPTLKAPGGSKSYSKLCLSLPPQEQELSKEIVEKVLRDFALETGVLPPAVSFEEGTSRVLSWNGIEWTVLSALTDGGARTELKQCLIRNASKLLCVKQVEARLTEIFTDHPELLRAYQEVGLNLMTTVRVLRELLDAGESLTQFPLLVELLVQNDPVCPRLGLADAVQRDLRKLGLSAGSCIRRPQSLEESIRPDDVVLFAGREILDILDPRVKRNEAGLLERASTIRRAISKELGFIVPGIQFRDSLQLKENEVKILIKGMEIYRFELHLDLLMVVGPKTMKLRGIKAQDPVFGMPVLWADPEGRKKYEKLGSMVFTPESVAAMALTEAIRRHSHRIFSTQQFRSYLDTLKKTDPSLVTSFVDGTSLTQLGKTVMCRLLEEQVSIRQSVTILETLVALDEDERNSIDATEQVRMVLRQNICQKYLLPDGTLAGFALSPTMEQLCRKGLREARKRERLELQSAERTRLHRAMNHTVECLQEKGHPLILIVENDLRRPLFQFFQDTIPNLVVLSKSEVGLVPEVMILIEVAQDSHIRRPARHRMLRERHTRRRNKPTRMYKRKRA